MSISDEIVVMKKGVVQQTGSPQDVYDNPVNLFVAKFLGTPPINVFDGVIKNKKLYLGEDAVLDVSDLEDQEVYVGIRPEGFILNPKGVLHCELENIEVMGRDVSVISNHSALSSESANTVIRSIVDADNKFDLSQKEIAFDIKPNKIFLFNKETQERIK